MDLDLQQLRALSAAVAEGTLDGAARVLHVTPSAVSQRLRALEAATGQVLLVRSKPVRVTDAGRPVLRLARQVELLMTDAALELDPAADGGRTPPLPVAVNADSLATWVLPALRPLADELFFRLRREDERRTSELLRDGTVLAAVSTDAEPVAGCRVVPLGAMRYRPVASPAFAARWFPDGPDAAAYARAPVVTFDRDDPLQRAHLDARSPGADPPVHFVPSSADFLEAVRLGFGWGLVPDLQADDDRRTGVLVELDPGTATDVALHWQQWRLRSPALDRLGEAVIAAGREALVQPAG
ncbi:LysR family transcriptional regulator ArgP [Patulibacter minatonensis]|uniref:LysR family transcriptional regulator ArgP n=1 Tax=Patulibacter minatonensis TaxID=298163 RepID=UPI00047CBEBB|nr:LysR family transcriptional regulator ArgP [Patulibacter minatonensis]